MVRLAGWHVSTVLFAHGCNDSLVMKLCWKGELISDF